MRLKYRYPGRFVVSARLLTLPVAGCSSSNRGYDSPIFATSTTPNPSTQASVVDSSPKGRSGSAPLNTTAASDDSVAPTTSSRPSSTIASPLKSYDADAGGDIYVGDPSNADRQRALPMPNTANNVDSSQKLQDSINQNNLLAEGHLINRQYNNGNPDDDAQSEYSIEESTDSKDIYDSASVQPSSRLSSEDKSTPIRFFWPIRGRIVSGFGIQSNGEVNSGIYLAAPAGTPVLAASAGTVIYAGNGLKDFGNLVLIQHNNGWVSAYAHNDEIKVRRGDTVNRGETIATVGQTGKITSPQLHFELRNNAKPVDPLPRMTDG